MADIVVQFQSWVKYIKELDLDIPLKSLQSYKFDKNHEKTNTCLYKLLLYLSHGANKCIKEKLSKENQIIIITSIIIENLSKVPDKNQFFSALYHIIQYLLSKHRFKEAKIVSSYLLPGKLLSSNDLYEPEKYHTISVLWYAELFKKLELIVKNVDKKTDGIDDEFLSNLRFAFRILNYCSEEFCYTLEFAGSCIRRFSYYPLSKVFPCILQIFHHLSNYFRQLKKYPLVGAYQHIILMLGQVFFKKSGTVSNPNILNYFRQCDALFIESLKSSPESYNCYRVFREYTINLFETNYMSKDIGGLRIKKCFKFFDDALERYGKDNESMAETIAALSLSFEMLFWNWEKLVSEQNFNIPHDDVLCIGEFLGKVYTILRNHKLHHQCPACPDPKSCKIKKNMYNASVITSYFIRVINRFNLEFISEEMVLLTRSLLDEMISVLEEFKPSGCKNLQKLWDFCGKVIFNFGIKTESKYPAELEPLYKSLCKQFVYFEGFDSKSGSFGLESPVSTGLIRLCTSNFNRGLYREAMTYLAYSALFSNTDSKRKRSYETWTNIKIKGIDSTEIQNLTMVKCLKKDAEVVKEVGIEVDLSNYDLVDLCLRELTSMYIVQVNLISSMKKTVEEIESRGNSLQYGKAVLLLCFHAVQFEKREIISDYILKAIERLKKSKAKSISSYCVLANLNFFRILEKLYVRKLAITEQMDDASFTMKAFKMQRGKGENEEDSEKDEVVPTYGDISIEEDNKCANELREVVNLWDYCFKKDLASVIDDWDPKFTLEAIILCGEYSRLYRFNGLEEKSWKLAYQLAATTRDTSNCVYITARSLSLRYINDTWISEAEKHSDELKDSGKTADADAATLFWLSLADFYLDCKKVEEAKELLDKVKVIPSMKLLGNAKLYLYYLDIQLRHFYTLNEKVTQQGYSDLMVKLHYSMISVYELLALNPYRFWCIRYQLLTCEVFFETMYNVAIPMIGLLSFREVVSHMNYSLRIAQKFGMTLRIAQFLKHFCYIDLLQLHAENCETRLQDLEHILRLEDFKNSMNTKVIQKLNSKFSELKIDSKTSNTVTVREAVHDPVSLSTNNASPELKKKLFTLPEFMLHSAVCQCFTCNNVYYQYLAFSCAHIRAQLYSILKYTKEAEQYFHGAFKIKSNIDERDADELRQYKSYKWSQNKNVVIDYILYILDFAMHIVDFEPEQKNDALALIEEALNIISQNGLEKHCVAVYATELYFQHYSYNLPQDKLLASICVPIDIPITITNQPSAGCITPKQQVEKTVGNPRRRKTPPAIPIVNVIDTSDEENNCGNSPMPKPPPLVQESKTRVRVRNVRRKILIDEVEEKEETPKVIKTRITRSKTPKEDEVVAAKSTRSKQNEEVVAKATKSKPKEEEVAKSTRSKPKEEEVVAKPTRTRSLRLKNSTGSLNN